MKKSILLSGKSITLNLFFSSFINLFGITELQICVSDPENIYNKKYICNKIILPNSYLELFNFFLIIKSIKSLRKIIKKNINNIFILNTPLLSILFRLASIGLNIDIVYVVHGYRFNSQSNKAIFLFFFILEYILSFKVKKYITINNYDYDITKKYFSNNIIKINGLGIDLNKFHKKSNKKLKNFSIGVLSAYRKNKGYSDLIKIALKLQKYKNIKIHCYGYDDYSKYLSQCNKLNINNIYFNNFEKNIKSKIDEFNILLHLSYREGLPIAPLQCLASAIPVIGYDIRGMNDLINNNYNGYLCDFKNLECIFLKIIKISEDKKLYENISNNAFKSIKSSYSSNTIAKIIYKYIHE